MRRSLQIIDTVLRPPKHNPDRKHAHAQKILNDLEGSIEEGIKSTANLKVSSHREILALHSQANVFAYDMQIVVHALQNIVINTFTDGVADPEISAAVSKFSQFAYSLQQCFMDDPEVLKNELKENLGKLMPEVQNLVASVKRNPNHEYIHEVIGAVDDILFAVHKIQLRNKLENDSGDDLVTYVCKLKEKVSTITNSFQQVNRSVLRDIKHSVRDSCTKIIRMVTFLDATADNYSEEIRTVLLKTAELFIRDIGVFDSGIRVKNDVTTIKLYNIINTITVCGEMEKVLELLKIPIADEEVANNLHNLIMTLLVHVIAVGTQLTRHIDLAGNQTSDD